MTTNFLVRLKVWQSANRQMVSVCVQRGDAFDPLEAMDVDPEPREALESGQPYFRIADLDRYYGRPDWLQLNWSRKASDLTFVSGWRAYMGAEVPADCVLARLYADWQVSSTAQFLATRDIDALGPFDFLRWLDALATSGRGRLYVTRAESHYGDDLDCWRIDAGIPSLDLLHAIESLPGTITRQLREQQEQPQDAA